RLVDHHAVRDDVRAFAKLDAEIVRRVGAGGDDAEIVDDPSVQCASGAIERGPVEKVDAAGDLDRTDARGGERDSRRVGPEYRGDDHVGAAGAARSQGKVASAQAGAD